MESASSRFNPDDLLRNSAWIAHLALHLTKSPADAEDLRQQTFLAVLEKPPAGGVLRRPWLAGVMRNLLNTRWTRDIRRERREEKVAKAAIGCTPEEALANGETRYILVGAVMGLPEPYCTAVLMKYFEGMSAAAIALELEVPAATVRSWVRRGLDLLRGNVSTRLGPEWKGACLALVPNLALITRRPDSSAAASSGTPAVSFVAALVAFVSVVGVMVWFIFGPLFAASDESPSPRGSEAVVGLLPVDEETPDRLDGVVRTNLDTTLSVSIVVVEAGTGRPIPRAELAIVAASGESPQLTQTEENGVGKVALLEDGEVAVRVRASGFFEASVDVSPAARDSYRVELNPAATIRLRIREREIYGEAAGRLEAVAWPSSLPAPGRPGGQSWGDSPSGYAKSDGTILIDQLAPGVRYDVIVAGGSLAGAREFRGVLPDGAEIDISIRRVYGVQLVLIDGNGEELELSPGLRCMNPSSGWRVGRAESRRLSPNQPVSRLLHNQLGDAAGGRPGEDLTFICARPLDWPRDEVQYWIEVPGFDPVIGIAPVRSLEDRVHRHVVTMVSDGSGRGDILVRIRGLETGDGLVGQDTRIGDLVFVPTSEREGVEQREFFWPVNSLEDGVQIVRGLPVGRYHVSMRPRGVPEAWQHEVGAVASMSKVEAVVDQLSTVEIEFPNHGVAMFLPQDAGEPYSGPLALSIKKSGHQFRSVVTWTGAPFTLSGLPEGHYTVSVLEGSRGNPRGLVLGTTQFLIAAGQETGIDLLVPPWGNTR